MLGLSVVLATHGIYRVMWNLVTEQSHEIGVRRAIGANRLTILAMVLKRALLLSGIGVGLGLIGGAALTKVIASHLYAVPALDPTTYALVATTLIAVAMLASWQPARRAASVDPVVVLRENH